MPSVSRSSVWRASTNRDSGERERHRDPDCSPDQRVDHAPPTVGALRRRHRPEHHQDAHGHLGRGPGRHAQQELGSGERPDDEQADRPAVETDRVPENQGEQHTEYDGQAPQDGAGDRGTNRHLHAHQRGEGSEHGVRDVGHEVRERPCQPGGQTGLQDDTDLRRRRASPRRRLGEAVPRSAQSSVGGSGRSGHRP